MKNWVPVITLSTLTVCLILHLPLLGLRYIPLLARIRHPLPPPAPSVNDLDIPQPNVFGMDRENVHTVKKSVTLFILVPLIDVTANVIIRISFTV